MSDVASLRPIAAVLISAVGIPLILAARRRPNVRESVTMAVALGKLAIVASMVPGVLSGTVYVTNGAEIVDGVAFSLRVDPLGLLFGLLASALWVVTSLYSVGYMRGLDEHSQTRYFASFAASLSAAIGVAFASNLVTLFVFYELLTVATYPLVAHNQDAEARAAGRKYLAYTFLGGVAVLTGTVIVYALTGTTAFTAGGISALGGADPVFARLAFALLAGGFGVKAALMPVHSWLPDAMVAPTPVSGLLHAVAVVKSGIFGIARVALDVFGPATVSDLGVGVPLAAVAAFTLLTASVIALRQDNLKRRLAYSTISQLSYIVLGLGVLSGDAIVGGLLHIPAHAFMKLTLFFCAGAIHVETHTDDISKMAGIGKRMPLTMVAFAVAAAGMAGIPLVAGFVSKWYLLIGSVSAGQTVFAVVLLVSGMLNIAYFWPIVYQAFFETADDHDGKPLIESPFGGRFGSSADVTDEVDETTDDGTVVTDGGDGGRGSDHVGEDHDVTGDSPDAHDESHDTHDESHDAHDESHDAHDDHHGGPPSGGWEVRQWNGAESTWFMLGPILASATGALALGVAPAAVVFLQLVQLIAANAGVVA